MVPGDLVSVAPSRLRIWLWSEFDPGHGLGSSVGPILAGNVGTVLAVYLGKDEECVFVLMDGHCGWANANRLVVVAQTTGEHHVGGRPPP